MLALAGAALPAAAAATAIAAIVASPATYDGQQLDVTGTVGDVKTKTSKKGNPYTTYTLCDGGACIHVFTFGSPKLADGASLTVHGTFIAVKHVGTLTIKNELDVDDDDQ